MKAVAQVPFTVGGQLAKEMRELEEKLETLTEFRLKITERIGWRLESILHKSDPWTGQDCSREGCLMCEAKVRLDKEESQSCFRRNIAYETWCHRCEVRDKAKYEQSEGSLGRGGVERARGQESP